jgi:protein TonB
VWVAVAAAAHAGVVAALLGLPSRVLVPAGEGPAVAWETGPGGAEAGVEAGGGAEVAAESPVPDLVPVELAQEGDKQGGAEGPEAVGAAPVAEIAARPEGDTPAETVAAAAEPVVAALEEDVPVGAVAWVPAVSAAVTETPPKGGVAPPRRVHRAAARPAAPVRAAAAAVARDGVAAPVTRDGASAPPAGGGMAAAETGGGGAEGPDPGEVAAWQAALSAWIARNQTYPPAARHRHDQGVVQVRFSLDERGRVVSVAVLRESGSAILDAAALALLQDAHLPAPPRRLDPARRTITVPIRYRLQ